MKIQDVLVSLEQHEDDPRLIKKIVQTLGIEATRRQTEWFLLEAPPKLREYTAEFIEAALGFENRAALDYIFPGLSIDNKTNVVADYIEAADRLNERTILYLLKHYEFDYDILLAAIFAAGAIEILCPVVKAAKESRGREYIAAKRIVDGQQHKRAQKIKRRK